MACQAYAEKFDFGLLEQEQRISNNLLCCLCLTLVVIIPYLGVQWAIFIHFHWLTFFLDPIRCRLSLSLEQWCRNITGNYIIILLPVNRQKRDSVPV